MRCLVLVCDMVTPTADKILNHVHWHGMGKNGYELFLDVSYESGCRLVLNS